jgi:hypothetical protein
LCDLEFQNMKDETLKWHCGDKCRNPTLG